MLTGAHLQSASLRGTFVWRADARTADSTDARVKGVESQPKFVNGRGEVHDWSLSDLKTCMGQEVPENILTQMTQMELRLNPETHLDEEKQIAEHWQKLQLLYAPDDYAAKLAKIWWQIGCSIDGAPYVLAGMIRTLNAQGPPTSKDSVQVPQVADGFLKDDCAGARGLSDDSKGTLAALRDDSAWQRPGSKLGD